LATPCGLPARWQPASTIQVVTRRFHSIRAHADVGVTTRPDAMAAAAQEVQYASKTVSPNPSLNGRSANGCIS
jgi:hypothetical protein